MTITRREFLETSGLLLAGTLASPHHFPPSPTVLCIVLQGGVDGLSMVVPYTEPRYYRDRPNIAIPANDVVDLDGRFGLHPGLRALKPFWDRGALSVIPAAGFAQPTRGHIEAQRCIRRLLSGATAVGSLTEAARVIRTAAPPRVLRLDVGGWDTHFNQGATEGQLATRLRALGVGISRFAWALGGRMRDVVLVTTSDFGRTIRENGHGGTDHGHATAVLLLSGRTNGGRVLGHWPGLDADQGVRVTTPLPGVLAALGVVNPQPQHPAE